MATAFETIAALRPRFAGIATGGHGLADFDAAALKDARPRLLTRDTPDLVRAFELHGLRMRPRP